MSMDMTVPEFIRAQEDAEFTTEDLHNKIASAEQDVTIREVGLYHHPLLMFRDGETKRLNRHLKVGKSHEDFEYLGTFEYEAIQYPTNPAQVSLMGFVLDDEIPHSIEEYDDWMNQNGLPRETFDAFKEWCEDDDSAALREIYSSDSDAIWSLSQGTAYEKGILSPLLSVVVLFEDDAGVFYTGVYPVDDYQEETKELLSSALTETEVEVEVESEDDEDDEDDGTSDTETDDAEDTENGDEEDSDEPTESDEPETVTEYETVETSATVRGRTIQIDEYTIEFESVFAPTWYTAPFLTHAFDNITEQSYDLIQTVEDGWYTATADVYTDGIHSKNELFLSVPYEGVPIPWEPSFEDGHIVRELFDTQDESIDELEEIEVRLRSPYTATDELVGDTYVSGRSYAWVVTPPVSTGEGVDNGDEPTTGTEADEADERSVNDTPDGILERLGLR